MRQRSESTAFRGLRWARGIAGMVASRFAGRHRPIWVNIEPTHRCNQACPYCDKATKADPGMSQQQLLGLVTELADMGTLSVCFDGGEPLLHPAITPALRTARAHGLRTSISTNGVLLRHRAEALRHLHVAKVSMDGPREIHDAVRGAGAYDQALDGVRCALDAGVTVALRMTLARHNVHAWGHVLDLARELGVQALFQPAIGSLMDCASPPDCESPDVELYRQALAALHAAKLAGGPVANELVCIDHLAQWPALVPVPFCAGGRVEIAIGPDGGMFPCGRVGRGATAPNVFELGVRQAFERVLRPTECANCWCTLTLGNCYAYHLSPRLLEGRLVRPRPFGDGRPAAAPAQARAPLGGRTE
jgi:MoaA/NifB/PqqE/SkfB family radical SAM enzyme